MYEAIVSMRYLYEARKRGLARVHGFRYDFDENQTRWKREFLASKPRPGPIIFSGILWQRVRSATRHKVHSILPVLSARESACAAVDSLNMREEKWNRVHHARCYFTAAFMNRFAIIFKRTRADIKIPRSASELLSIVFEEH